MTSWLIGIDDTDTVDSPGTNKLVLHLADKLAGQFQARLIVRHQLLVDPRVPYTSHNGCASLLVETQLAKPADLTGLLVPEIVAWCPAGSDPGLCIARSEVVDAAVIHFAQRCQREVVTQEEAQGTAAAAGLYLQGLGGSHDGIIGALAAVGLLATRDDGRILHAGATSASAWSQITGWQSLDDLHAAGVCEVRRLDTSQAVERGRVLLSKRLRPNLRAGRSVLFVEPADAADGEDAWQAVKLV